MTRAVVPNAVEGKQRVDYTYDSKSRRVMRKEGREHTLYIYDRWNCIAEYRVSGRNADSVLTTRYVWGTDLSGSLQHRDLSGADGDEVEARRVRYAMNRMSDQRAGGVGGLLHADEVTNGRGKTKGYYFHYDGNGNVTAVTNAKGRRAASYTYDAFGNTLESEGDYADQNKYRLMLLARRPPLGPPYGSPSRSARFSTKPLDEVTGFYYYGYRHYDPVTGRWPSRDPIEERGGANLYLFILNRFTGLTDLLGLCCQPERDKVQDTAIDVQAAEAALRLAEVAVTRATNDLTRRRAALEDAKDAHALALVTLGIAETTALYACAGPHAALPSCWIALAATTAALVAERSAADTVTSITAEIPGLIQAKDQALAARDAAQGVVDLRVAAHVRAVEALATCLDLE